MITKILHLLAVPDEEASLVPLRLLISGLTIIASLKAAVLYAESGNKAKQYGSLVSALVLGLGIVGTLDKLRLAQSDIEFLDDEDEDTWDDE